MGLERSAPNGIKATFAPVVETTVGNYSALFDKRAKRDAIVSNSLLHVDPSVVENGRQEVEGRNGIANRLSCRTRFLSGGDRELQ